MLMTFISLCLYHQAFSEMFHHLLEKLSLNIKMGPKRAEAMICDIIRFRSMVQE